ncbi:hypothetical protein GCM10009104_08640 [Marinobacterium maritimum]|uniref:Uncharacterized protein n=1 Tax=Marinobacterium maritimum TaxID=500162 RepID=A0ABN1I398_9GAMM
MTMYYVDLSPEAEGCHLVHREDCGQIAEFEARRLSGEFDCHRTALTVAAILFESVDCCEKCVGMTPANRRV